MELLIYFYVPLDRVSKVRREKYVDKTLSSINLDVVAIKDTAKQSKEKDVMMYYGCYIIFSPPLIPIRPKKNIIFLCVHLRI